MPSGHTDLTGRGGEAVLRETPVGKSRGAEPAARPGAPPLRGATVGPRVSRRSPGGVASGGTTGQASRARSRARPGVVTQQRLVKIETLQGCKPHIFDVSVPPPTEAAGGRGPARGRLPSAFCRRHRHPRAPGGSYTCKNKNRKRTDAKPCFIPEGKLFPALGA